MRQNDSEKKDRRVIPLLGVQVNVQDGWPIGSYVPAGLQRLRMRRKKSLGTGCDARKTQLKWSTGKSAVENGLEQDRHSFVGNDFL